MEEQFKKEVEEEVKNHRKLMTVVAFLMLVLAGGLIATGAWYYLTKINKDNLEFKSLYKPQTKEVDVSKENLETYKDAGLKISFQYPKEWKVDNKLPKDGKPADVNQPLAVWQAKNSVSLYINPVAGDFGLHQINVYYDAAVENGKISLKNRTESKEESDGVLVMTNRFNYGGKVYWFVAIAEHASEAKQIEIVFKQVVESFKFE